jgi:hypothetical protein
MSNIFQFTPQTYFQIPEAAIESGKWASLKSSAKDLYTLLLYVAQKNSNTLVMLTAVDAAKVGLSVNAVKAGRDGLLRAKLISAERTSDGYSYEILDPVIGASLERVENLTTVAAEVVGLYFLEYLANRNHVETVDGLKSACPFHDEKKDRDKNLSVTFSDGGAFHCHHCETQGGILDFETLMAAKDGEKINRDRAYSRVRAIHLRNMRKQRRQQARDAAAVRAML